MYVLLGNACLHSVVVYFGREVGERGRKEKPVHVPELGHTPSRSLRAFVRGGRFPCHGGHGLLAIACHLVSLVAALLWHGALGMGKEGNVV